MLMGSVLKKHTWSNHEEEVGRQWNEDHRQVLHQWCPGNIGKTHKSWCWSTLTDSFFMFFHVSSASGLVSRMCCLEVPQASSIVAATIRQIATQASCMQEQREQQILRSSAALVTWCHLHFPVFLLCKNFIPNTSLDSDSSRHDYSRP